MDIRVESVDLRLGMYVTELDRPWEDTNFMFQGFLITSEEQIRELQAQCAYVIVTQEKSSPGVFEVKTSAPTKKTVTVAQASTPTFSYVLDEEAPERPAKGKGLFSALKQIGKEILQFKKTDDETELPQLKGALTIQFEEDERRAEIQRRQEVRALRTKFSGQPLTPDVVVDYSIKTSIEEELVSARKLNERIEVDLEQSLMLEMTGADLGDRINVAKEVLSDVVESIIRNPNAMLLVSNLKRLDKTQYKHALDVSIMMVSFGRQLGIPKEELNHIALGGLLHDLGKSKVSKEILEKPQRLNASEYEQARRHVEYGSRILDDIPTIHPIVRQIVERHHERYDGKGYPEQLYAERIGIYGSMAGIVETYATMTDNQPYAPARSSAKAVSVLVALRDKAFQAELVDQFIQVVGVYPIGSIVQLSTGEIGIVSRQNKLWRLKPLVTVVVDAKGNKLNQTYVIDLVRANKDDEQQISIVNELPAGSHGIDARDYFI